MSKEDLSNADGDGGNFIERGLGATWRFLKYSPRLYLQTLKEHPGATLLGTATIINIGLILLGQDTPAILAGLMGIGIGMGSMVAQGVANTRHIPRRYL